MTNRIRFGKRGLDAVPGSKPGWWVWNRQMAPGAWKCLLPQGWRSRLCYFLGRAANSSFTEDVISKDDTQMLLLGFSFTFFFFFFATPAW